MAEGQLVRFGDEIKVGGDSTSFLGIKRILTATKPKDWGSVAGGAQATEDVTVTGAALGDLAFACMDDTQTGASSSAILHAYVSAANTVRVVLANVSAAAIDLPGPNAKLRVVVFDIT